MVQILEITQNTVFKRQPLQVAQLGASDTYTIGKGTKLILQSYAYADAEGDFNGHIKFALQDQKDYIHGLNTWFVYELHAHVLEDGKVVYPQDEDESAFTLKITQDTVLKRSPVMSSQLQPADMEPVKQGTQIELLSYAYADDSGEFNNHIKFAIAEPQDYIRGITTWYVYENHAQVFFDEQLVYPLAQSVPQSQPKPIAIPSVPKPTGSGRTIALPGYKGTFYLNQPIIPGGSFTWAEATKEGTRIPANKRIVDNIIGLAKALERPRKQLGRTFRITSWYRDPASNRRAGGARSSLHLYGKAADIYIEGYSQRQAARELEWWPGGLGSYNGWVHLDIGPRRRWRQ